jgi:photosystem II stability/assembly factor-like uncharacterized protein
MALSGNSFGPRISRLSDLLVNAWSGMIASTAGRMARRALAATLICVPLPVVAADASALHWELIDAHTSSGLRGIHRAGDSIWVSGTNGAILRSADSGGTWQSCSVPPGAAKLDFRAVWAWDSEHAIVMSSGPGDQSRLFRTTDGCRGWQPGLVNADPAGFWDALVFSGDNGVILGDPVGGRFVILRTRDSGLHWTRDESPLLAALPEGEGAFAASNSALFSLVASASRFLWFATSGPGGPRIFRSQDRLLEDPPPERPDWLPVKAPLDGSTAASGVFSLCFRDSQNGVAVGGNYEKPDQTSGTAAITTDGGKTWIPATHPPSGYRSAVEWDPAQKLWVAVGTNGSDASFDDGKTWQPFDAGKWNALSLPFAVGPQGRVARLVYK